MATPPHGTPRPSDASSTAQDVGSGTPDSDPLGDRVVLDRAREGLFGTPFEARRVGRFSILKEIGRGAMGVVFAAYDAELDRRVAIKLLRQRTRGRDQQGSERLIREARAMAKLTHPNICAVYDAGRYEGSVFVAMEFIDGRTLRDWSAEADRSWRDVLDVFRHAGHGLAAAHAAGLIHRDFKPDNVMLGVDGRVRVMDFGLARRVADATEPVRVPDGADEGGGVADDRLTRTGAMVGTPAYMAPEQLLGATADAPSDQFAFCVALYEALYGERPFAGETLPAVAFNVTAGNVRPAPEHAGVPTRIRRVLLRGLLVAPEERWPSMEALLDALRVDRTSGLRRLVVASVVALGVGSVAGSGLWSGERDTCSGAERRLVDVWDEAARTRTRAAMVATGAPFAQQTWERLERSLDRYAAEWVVQHRDACEATNVRGEQSADMLDRRMTCLERRRRQMGALVRALEHIDGNGVEAAIDAAAGLPSTAACGDLVALAVPIEAAPDPAVRRRADELRATLDEVHALELATRFEEALDAARRVAAEATELGYRPVIAEAGLRVGSLQAATGTYEPARTTLMDAFYTARASGHEALAREAATLLVWVVGRLLEKHEEAMWWARFVLAEDHRLSLGPRERAALLDNIGSVLRMMARYDDAIEHYGRAIEMLPADDPEVGSVLHDIGTVYGDMGQHERAAEYYRDAVTRARGSYGDDHPAVANALNSLGNSFAVLGQGEKAAEHYRESLRIRERSLGWKHPHVMTTVMNLGTVYYDQGQHTKALELFERALTIAEQTLGPDHPELGPIYGNLANTELALGRREVARDDYLRALRVVEAAYGEDHPTVARMLNGLAVVVQDLGDPRAALDALRRSVAILEKSVGPRHPELGIALTNVARAQRAFGQPRAALPFDLRGLTILELSLGQSHPTLTFALTGLGRSLVELRRWSEAIPHLERALAICEVQEPVPLMGASVRVSLADALLETRRDLARARRLAEHAYSEYAASPTMDPDELRDVEVLVKRLGGKVPSTEQSLMRVHR